MVSTSEIRRGMTIDLDGQLLKILEFDHQKIGRGSAQVRSLSFEVLIFNRFPERWVAARFAAITRWACDHTFAVHAAGLEQRERQDQPRAMPGAACDGTINGPVGPPSVCL